LVDPDGKSPDCCPWQEFATGFADRAAQISFPAYGAFTASKALYFDSPEIASGYYQYAEKLISGQGTLTDYLALVDISGTARTINEMKHIAELYGDGEYEELGAYAYTAILAVFAAGAEIQSNMRIPGSLKITAKNPSASEIRAAEHMKNQGKKVVLRDPIDGGAQGRTSDLLVNRVPYDVYTPKTGNPNRIVSAIRSKNSQASGIILDLSESSVNLHDLGNLLDRVRGAGATNITDIITIKQ
jgi:filamentous hemagglutinin